jgi:tetratricopeptide (TPR) repeat protein
MLGDEAGLLALVATARLTEAWIWNWSGEGSIEDFARIVERAVEAARMAGDEPGEIEARQIGSSILWGTGHLDEYVKINERLVEQARSIGDSARAATILLRLANAQSMRGNQAAADRHLSEAEAIAATDGLRDVAQEALRLRGHEFLFAGDVGAAEATYRQWLAAAKDSGSVQEQVGAHRWLGNALMEHQRWEAAAAVLDEALELSEASGERWHRSELFGLRARAALGLGDLGLADRLIARAAELFRDGDITAISEAHEHLGLIRTAQGRHSEAEAAFRRSIDVLAGSEYHSLKTSPTFALAKFLATRGRIDEAAPLLEERARWVHDRNFHLWDPEIEEIRNLLETARDPEPGQQGAT